MSRTLINRIKLILVASLVAVCCFWVGIVSFAKAEPALSSVDELQTFAVTDASLIVEGDDGINGLEFKATISAEEYQALMGAGFAEVETGLVIMPGYYALPQAGGMPAFADEDTMFGKDAIYDWAEYDEEAKEYVYNGTKTQIININANEWVNEGEVYAYYGAIVDIYDHNEDICFTANAYIKTTDVGGVVNYKFTNPFGASVAVEVETEYAGMTDDQKAWVDANWTKFETIEEDLLVYDVTGQDTVMLAQIVATNISKEANIKVGMIQPEVYVAIDNNGNEIDMMENMGGTIDLTDANNIRMYTVMGKIGDTVLFTMPIDLRSKTAPFLWNDEISMGSVDAITYQGADKVRKSYYSLGKGNPTEETIDGADYVSFTASGDQGTWFSWKPLHDKSYYEGFRNKGVSLSATLKVDASGVINPDDEYGVLNQQSVFDDNDGVVSIKKDHTHTDTITLEKLLDNWAKYVGCDWDKTWGGRYPLGMAYVYNVHNGGKIYVGDFKVIVDVSANAVKDGDILVNTTEVSDLTALDLTKYISEEGLAVIDEYKAFGLSYEMKGYSIADEIEVTDLTKVDVSNAKRAAYILNVKTGASVLYTATVDLYNTADAVVWAESLTTDNVVARQNAYGTGFPATASNFITDYEIVSEFVGGTKTYTGSFVKFTVTEAMNITFDVKALHTKSYYNSMIADSTKILFLRVYYPIKTSIAINGGMNNYGMNSSYSTWRQGTAAGYDNVVLSLDNYAIANSASETYSGKWYNWDNIENLKACRDSLVQFEISSSMISSSSGAYELHVGFSANEGSIVDAGESLATADQIKGQVIDFTTQTSFDLINLLPETSHAKYKAFCAAWANKTGKKAASAVGFNLTINGTVHSVIPTADGEVMLNLDDYVVATNKTVSTTTTVRDLLNPGNNTVNIIAYAPPVVSMGVGAWPVSLFAGTTITIVGPNA